MNSDYMEEYDGSQISSVYLRCVLQTLKEIDRNDIVEKLALEHPFLATFHPEKTAIVSLDQLIQIYVATCKMVGDAEFIIRMGRNLKINHHGELSNLLISAPNLKSALECLAPFYQLRAPFLNISLEEHGDRATVVIDFTFMHDTPLEQVVSGLLAGVSLNVLHFYGLNNNDEFDIRLKQLSDAAVSRYREFYAVTPREGKKTFSISFPRKFLQAISPLADRELFDLAIKNCELLALEKTIKPVSSFSERVTQMILENPEQDWSQESMARHLHMSVSTLRRRFTREGVSYKHVVTSAKMRTARSLLLKTDMQITEISQHLGFSDASNFSSAFKRHTGHSPREFRSKLMGGE